MVVTVSVGGGPERAISPYLASMSLVYSWAPDAVYGNASRPNSTMADWARKHHLATARYPGGEASYWNWEDPSGVMGRSTLDPTFTDAARAAAPVDEPRRVLGPVRAAALRPLIGVNYNCHRNPWVPRDASIARAVRQVRHVVKRGFPGALWYIGNEDAALGNAEALAAHARAMRAVDPTAKIFFNENAITPASLERFLNEVGNDAFDGVEFHGKWPFGVPRAAAARDVCRMARGGAAHRTHERPDVARQDWWDARSGDQAGEARLPARQQRVRTGPHREFGRLQ